jgi:hypothetical protein
VQNCRRAILGETPWNLIGSDERMLYRLGDRAALPGAAIKVSGGCHL